MVQHLPFSNFDMAGITQTVDRYKTAGLHPEYNADEKAQGVVSISFENPMGVGESLWVHFEIHKVARKRWFGVSKPHWVVQLRSQGANSIVDKRGCVAASTQAHAISAAEVDMKHRFVSICSFELASEA